MKRKIDLETSSNPKRKSHEKNCSKTRISRVRTRIFYMKLYMSTFIRKTFQVLGFVNPVVDSGDDDDNIFKSEGRFFVFNTFIN